MTSRYDELSPRALWFLQNFDELDLADICANNEAAAAKAQAAVERVREIHQETCLLATGKVKPVAFTCSLCDALDRPEPPAPDGGPSVAECAADDEAHWTAKYAREGA